MQVGYQEKAIVAVLQLCPIVQRAIQVTDMARAGWAVSGEDSFERVHFCLLVL
jgi:hypothetical protein